VSMVLDYLKQTNHKYLWGVKVTALINYLEGNNYHEPTKIAMKRYENVITKIKEKM